MAHTITIGRNTNPKRTRLGGSHEFGISGRTGPSLRNAQEHTAITVVENVPGSRWNRLNNALPSAFRPGRKHSHTARRRIGGAHRESRPIGTFVVLITVARPCGSRRVGLSFLSRGK